MKLFSRLGLLAAFAVGSFACLTESADAQIFPIFKNRKKACCCAEPAPEPEPVCCPAEEPEPEPCCAAPEPAPEPAPCCAAAEPAPEPEPSCPESVAVCEVSAPEPVAPAPPCCCGTAMTEAPATEAVPTEAIPEVAAYGMPDLAEGEVLVSISPVEIPTDEASTATSAPAE